LVLRSNKALQSVFIVHMLRPRVSIKIAKI
jgi:hypothetical protein